MKFRIHGEHEDGTEGSIVLEADTIEELQEQAKQEVTKRSWSNPWSEEL